MSWQIVVLILGLVWAFVALFIASLFRGDNPESDA